MESPKTFKEFWPIYLSQHRQTKTQFFHIVGSLSGLVSGLVFISYGYWSLVPSSFIMAYGLAWFSHFRYEKNKPTTFRYPLWSFFADWKMIVMILRGLLGKSAKHPE